jgi:hypothetical protein
MLCPLHTKHLWRLFKLCQFQEIGRQQSRIQGGVKQVEELEALRKNKTWELTHLPVGKKVVSCKWIYTVQQNPEGKVERYKEMLVARGYSQTYGIDYDETFAPVAKMNTENPDLMCC